MQYWEYLAAKLSNIAYKRNFLQIQVLFDAKLRKIWWTTFDADLRNIWWKFEYCPFLQHAVHKTCINLIDAIIIVNGRAVWLLLAVHHRRRQPRVQHQDAPTQTVAAPPATTPGPEGVARGSATDKNMINYMLSLFGTLAFSSHR